ncbi:MAG: metal-sensitive transcriptional regulator [Candidatus Omnitrophota bacterium]
MTKEFPSHKQKLDALKRVEGQVRGIQAMIKEGRYCVDIITQISAVRAALLRIQKAILETHMKSCVMTTFDKNNKAEQIKKIDEIMDLIKKI